MGQSTVDSNVYVRGRLSCESFSPPADSITDTAIPAGAAIDALKLQQIFRKQYAQDYTASAAVGRQVVHVVRGATGSLRDFVVGISQVAAGAATAVVTLRKNGSIILSSNVTINNANTAFVPVAAAGFTSSALVAGDCLEIEVVSAAAGGGTLPKGLFAEVSLTEMPS